MTRFCNLAAACVTGSLLIACGGGSNGGSQIAPVTRSASGVGSGAPCKEFRGGHIYVGFSRLSSYGGTEVDTYPMGQTRTSGEIYFDGGLVDAVAVDSSNDCYVSNYFRPGRRGDRTGSVFAADPGQRQIEKNVSSPYAIALDANENLYVANVSGKFANTVSAYVAHTSNVLEVLSAGVAQPTAIAFDGAGNVYIANYAANDVTVYPPGSNSLSYTISSGVGEPLALAFDVAGNLYVANSSLNDVTVYPPGSQTPSKTISSQVVHPNALAFDSTGDLYVLNKGQKNGHVSVYDPTNLVLIRKIATGIRHPFGIVLDSEDRLYVGNHDRDVVFFAAHSSQRIGVIRDYFDELGAVAIAFGP